MNVIDEFEHVEVVQSMLRVLLLLSVAVLQPLIACIDVHLNIYQPVPPLQEVVHNREQFFVIDWPIVLYGLLGFCMVIHWIKLLAFVDNIVLGQDASYCQIACINNYDYLERLIELCEDRSSKEYYPEFVAGLLLSMSSSEGNIFRQADKQVCFSTVVDINSTIIVHKG